VVLYREIMLQFWLNSDKNITPHWVLLRPAT